MALDHLNKRIKGIVIDMSGIPGQTPTWARVAAAFLLVMVAVAIGVPIVDFVEGLL